MHSPLARSTNCDSNTCLKRPKRLKRPGALASGASGIPVLNSGKR
jgi:hypothetical protein